MEEATVGEPKEVLVVTEVTEVVDGLEATSTARVALEEATDKDSEAKVIKTGQLVRAFVVRYLNWF